MADDERKDTPETERGFGTGLREQLKRRRDPQAPATSPAATVNGPASFVVTVEASPTGVAPVTSSESDLLAQLRDELAEALGRERDLRTALAEQVDAYERRLAEELEEARRATQLDEKAGRLSERESAIAQGERRIAQERQQLENERRRLSELRGDVSKEQKQAAEGTRSLASTKAQLETREREVAGLENELQQRSERLAGREDKLGQRERKIETAERDAKTRAHERAVALDGRESTI
jgi:DNA repair exonuclease SbcCD ATPase subunit